MAFASPWRRVASTTPSSVHSKPGASVGFVRTYLSPERNIESHLPVSFGVLAPILSHLDEQEQMHGGVQHGRNRPSGVSPDRAEHLPVFADHNPALALPFNKDGL